MGGLDGLRRIAPDRRECEEPIKWRRKKKRDCDLW